jgi:hypothetical protein
MLRKLHAVEIHILASQKDQLTGAFPVVVLSWKGWYLSA